MTRYTLSEFYNIRRSMKKRLTVYMIALGLILAAALIAAVAGAAAALVFTRGMGV